MRIRYGKLELAYAIGTYGHTKVCPVAILRGIQQLAYSTALPEPQESAESKYLGHRMLFTLENQCSYTRKLPKIYEKNNYETNPLHTRSRAIKYMSNTIAVKPKNAK